MSRLRIATYNLHSGIGLDRRFRPQRISDVIAELDADIIAIQELLSPVFGCDVHEHLRRETGFHLATMTTMQLAGGTFGNAVLSRWPIQDHVEHDLTIGAQEPRGALDVIIGRGRSKLRVMATHLGLRTEERRLQISRLVEIARAEPDVPTVLAGDLNVRRARGRELIACLEYFGNVAAPNTFPSITPILPLDRIFASPSALLLSVEAHRSRRARIASDHLPLVATIELQD
ncbi:MAG TPA: endonuclease/exonuclease/phosphatase family protein [Rhodanobacteraceae bacterium]|nr:endonuclease/exonuclease/phosphatase family protein [Rhodanobacteraceae bacterium]